MTRELGKTYQQIEDSQIAFDFLPGARVHDPTTSHEAIEKFTESGARLSHCEQIMEAIEDFHAIGMKGVTGKEIAIKSGLDFVAVMRRLHDLRMNGKIVKGAARICRTDGKSKLLTWWLAG